MRFILNYLRLTKLKIVNDTCISPFKCIYPTFFAWLSGGVKVKVISEDD
jgi:hypothetical protein